MGNVSSIACQRLGMPPIAKHLHTEILRQNRYCLKTAYRISTNHYSHTEDLPLQGQGQGSGNAASSWNAVNAPMWHGHRHICPFSLTTTTPDRNTTTNTQGVAFVDNATTMLNTPLHLPIQPPEILIDQFTQLVQSSEWLLFSTGGEINAQKSHYYAVMFTYTGTSPRMIHHSEQDFIINLINSTNKNTSQALTQKDINKAVRTLGVWLCPTGKLDRKLAWLQEKADNLDNNKLRPREVTAAYKFYYLPSITYLFPITTFKKTQCNDYNKILQLASSLPRGITKTCHEPSLPAPKNSAVSIFNISTPNRAYFKSNIS